MEQMTFDSLVEAYDQAETKVVPYVVVDKELAVAGDANETEKKSHDYKITFRVPKDGAYVHKTVEYKDVFITPRMDTKVVKALTAIIPYLRKVKTGGTVEKYTDEEKVKIFESLGDDFYDAIYELVGTVLKIDKDLIDYMTPQSVMDAATQIILDYPETVNEADTFF